MVIDRVCLNRRQASRLIGFGIGAGFFEGYRGAWAQTGGGLPSDSGILDVRQFGAVGDGVADDTGAILRAIAGLPAYGREHPYLARIIYFPTGTYRVTDTILRKDTAGAFQPNLVLIGQDRAQTIIKLSDRLPGFGDVARPKAVIFTASGLKFMADPHDGGRDYPVRGEGNEAFANTVENLTIDVGADNPGAIGIDFLSNNVGAVRAVTIRAPSRAAIGLSMTRRWPGPALISDVDIRGFDIGIDIAHSNYSMTMDGVSIEGSTQYGVRNTSNVLSFHNLQIATRDGCGLSNAMPDGLVVGIRGRISGAGSAALINRGTINFKDVAIEGFRTATGTVTEALDGVSRDGARLSEAPWRLPVQSAPAVEPIPPSEWVSVAAFGATPGKDSTGAFQAAFASKARVVYIPTGQYAVSKPFDVADNIERIEGMFAVVKTGNDPRAVPGTPSPLFRTKPTRRKPLFIRRLVVERAGNMSMVVDHRAPAPLVMSDIVGLLGTGLLYRPAEGGPAFLDNTSAGRTEIAGPRGVWCRQFNAEGPTVRVTNDGAPLWILGAKSEQTNTLIRSINGANTELVGGFIFRVFGGATEMPAFVNVDGRMALSYAEEATRPAAIYSIHFDSTVGGRHTVVRDTDLPRRGRFARMAPSLSTDDLPQ